MEQSSKSRKTAPAAQSAVEQYKQELIAQSRRSTAPQPLHSEKKTTLGGRISQVGDAVERAGDFVGDVAEKIDDFSENVSHIGGKVRGAANLVSGISGHVSDVAEKAGNVVEHVGERVEAFTERVGDFADRAGAVVDRAAHRVEPIIKKAEPIVKTGLAVAGAAAGAALVAEGVERGVEAMEHQIEKKHAQAHQPRSVVVPPAVTRPIAIPPVVIRPLPQPVQIAPLPTPVPIQPIRPTPVKPPTQAWRPNPDCPIHGTRGSNRCPVHATSSAAARPGSSATPWAHRAAVGQQSVDVPEAPVVFAAYNEASAAVPAYEIPQAIPVTAQSAGGRGAQVVTLPKVAYEGTEPDLYAYQPGDAQELPLPTYSTLEDFLSKNQSQGYLTVNVLTADTGLPAPGAYIYITKSIGGTQYLFQQTRTNQNGQAQRLALPAPDPQYSFAPPEGVPPYAMYDVTVTSAENTLQQELLNVSIFSDTESVQVVRLGLRPQALDEAAYTP